MASWLEDLEEAAREVLPEAVHRYFRQGARGGAGVDEAVAAWRSVRFAPHVLRDVTAVEVSTSLLGTPVDVPFAVAPTTLQRLAHPDGELAVARATAAAGSLMVVSSNAGTPFAAIGETGVAWWVQCYLPQDRSLALPLLARAREAGARAVVLTVDTPVVGTKYDTGATVWDGLDPGLLRVNFDPGYDDRPGSGKATDLGPADIAWLGEHTGLPVVVKGVLRPDDARRCIEAGAAAVWVSHHGGRQLERAVAPGHVLAAVAAVVGESAELYVDGGVRTGLDVLAALASGARCAFLGRLPLWSLVHGEAGVARMHAELHAELVEALRLCGLDTARNAPGILAPEPPFGA